MAVTPDLEGFADAQRRLRQQLGVDVTFLGEPVVTFPPGTILDDETGLPYDPLIQPTASAQASGVLRCTVSHRPLREDQDKQTQIGVTEAKRVKLITDPQGSAIAGSATGFLMGGEEYKIVGLDNDAPVAGGDRLLIFGRRAGRAHA